MAIAVILIVIAITYLILVKGRTPHRDLSSFKKWNYAHRGLHRVLIPENSMAAFSAAKNAGYGIELDVHLMRDGNLAVIHDASLKRTAGADIHIEEMTALDLENYRLEGTQERIPLLFQVLDLIQGEVPLIVELKPERNNYAALCDAACRLLDSYKGLYCVESFDPRCVTWLRRHREDIIRGQLTENFFRSRSKLPWYVKFVMKHQLLNVFSQPDFVAYRFSDRKTVSNFLCRKLWGMQGVAWTIRTQEDLNTARKENWIPIFENFEP